LENAPFEPEAMMQDVAELLSTKAFAKNLEVAVCVRPSMPKRLIGDEGRFKQILFNLAGNAVKFTERGGVLLEYGAGRDGRWRFSVRDTGPGVAPADQARIFEEFTQADAGIARHHGGTGLGLAIVKKLARAFGGEVGLTSAPGQGATFWVDLALEAEGAENSVSDMPPLQGVRVGLRTPTPILERALIANLTCLGASVCAPNEASDVILVDWRVPPDAETLAQLKSQARALIALAPQEDREAIEQARAAGIEHYALKPVRRRSLLERIQAALGSAPKAVEADEQDNGLPPELKGLRVLLAEDNPINALLARTLLTRAGCLVDAVQDGVEAVAAAQSAPYDLILLDIRMPRLDGIGAARRIRALGGPVGATPILALTAESGEDEEAHALQAGMNGFVTKPIDSARLYRLAARFTRGAKNATIS
jgi:CheY-like chemotaxis protein